MIRMQLLEPLSGYLGASRKYLKFISLDASREILRRQASTMCARGAVRANGTRIARTDYLRRSAILIFILDHIEITCD